MQLTDSHLLLAPSDLNDFVECRHLTQLNLRVKRGELEIEPTSSVEADLLSRKGEEHERAYLEQLKAEGRDVFEVPAADWDSGLVEAAATTEQAMRDGRSGVRDRGSGLAIEHDLLAPEPAVDGRVGMAAVAGVVLAEAVVGSAATVRMQDLTPKLA